MTAKDLSVVVRGIAPVVREYVALGLTSLAHRLDALEAKALTPGRDGKDGAPGERGPDGAVGPAGERGAAGPEGPAGKDGAPGERGADGAPGERGPEGPAGPSGRDGLPGRDGMTGPQGEKGLDGAPGRDGLNGKDGTLENVKILYDGERTVTFCMKDGREIEGGTITFPVLIYKGVFSEGTTYRQGDVVTYAGNAWHCRKETTVKPDYVGLGPQPKDFWTLMVKQGRDGRDGKDGALPPPVVKVGGSR